MAATFRLSTDVFISALDSNARQLVDQFERELIELLGRQRVSRSDVLDRFGGPSWSAPGAAQILVSTTTHDDWEARAHVMSRVDNSVTVPIVIEHPLVRIGPVADGVGACSSCMSKRMNQHRLNDDFDHMRRQAFKGTDGGPHLLLPHEVEVLFAQTLALLQEVAGIDSHRRSGSGRVVWFDLMSSSTTSGAITGVHGCPTCGGQAGAPAERTWKFIANKDV